MNYQEEAYTEKIQRFLSGEMTNQERTEFEALIEQDDALRDEVEFQRGLTAFMEDEGALKIETKVRALRNHQQNQSSFPWKKAIAAILIIGIIAVPVYFFLANQTPDPTVLADNYFEPYPDMITQMSSDKDSMNLALERYNEQDYEAAEAIFTALGRDTIGYRTLYLSICQMQTDQPSKAVVTLNQGIKTLTNQNNLEEVLQWYLILALLKDDKVDEAKKELKVYFDSGYRYNLDKAQKLAEDLKINN